MVVSFRLKFLERPQRRIAGFAAAGTLPRRAWKFVKNLPFVEAISDPLQSGRKEATT
jgi:hypothetical protein